MTETVAFVSATGGAGTTRLALESAGTLARTGRDVAILDAAYGTMGLATYVTGAIDPDLTSVVTGDGELTDALVDVPVDAPGAVRCCPAAAPFERLARAKTAGAAERLEKHIAAAALGHDAVIVDTPPVAANQAVAAVNATERTALVAPDSIRGRDAVATMDGRLSDVGVGIDAVIATFADGESILGEADARIPETDVTDPEACPSCLPPDETFAPAVAVATEAALGIDLSLEFPDESRLDVF